MYAFVFNWTPALSSTVVPPPYGLIFALFMMSCMSGASVSTLLDGVVSPAWRLMAIYGAGCAALVTAAGVCNIPMLRLIFASFCVFEFCVGIYFPSMGVLKSEVVPECVRGTMYNLYRVPLNAIVVAALMTDLTTQQVYALCAALFGAGMVCVGLVNASSVGKRGELLGAKSV